MMRHNALRNAEAKLMEEVCKDVSIEPQLIPTDRERVQGNVADNARLDIAARGVWSAYERTFFDIRVTHPNADSHIAKPLNALYRENEMAKKREYNDRVINAEKGTFTPLVFSTTGGMGQECQKLNKRLAELIALKRNESYSQVMQHIRCRLRFALLKATLVAVRGVRGGHGRSAIEEEEEQIRDISFNLIPRHPAYEPL